MEQRLREKIEEMVGRKLVVPRDFVWLSEQVEEHTQQRVSGTTLRRSWDMFINHEPAYLHAWQHGDAEAATYAIGKKNGIVVERYLVD